ncbi:MAG: methyltransferase, partial [Clostridiaceae bacterium]|nr:methyltransferase [Clostridiaceae bacterium]
MSQSHYFNPDPSLDHQHQIIGYSLSGHNFSFKTDKGVFSKDKVDHGTNVMLKAILKDQNNFPDQAEITALDFGCGYGVVSIVLQEILAKENIFNQQNWFSLDINQRAIALAKQNAIRSGAKISFLESDGIPLDFGK